MAWASEAEYNGRLPTNHQKQQFMVTKRKPRERATTAAHDEKRLEIIEHCAVLFDKVGYHGLTMQMLADEAGLGKPTLYHYFSSKADILFEMLQLHLDAAISEVAAVAAQCDDPEEVLVQACAFTLREIATHPGYVRAVMEHYGDLEGERRAEIRKRRQAYFDLIAGAIGKGIETGQFRQQDPAVSTLVFVGMCNWAYKWYPAMASKNAPEKMARTLSQVFLDGLNAPADAGAEAIPG